MSLIYRLLRIETNFAKPPLLLDPQLQLDPRERVLLAGSRLFEGAVN